MLRAIVIAAMRCDKEVRSVHQAERVYGCAVGSPLLWWWGVESESE